MTHDDVGPLTELFAVPEVATWWPGENEPRLRARLEDDDEGVGLVIEPRREGLLPFLLDSRILRSRDTTKEAS